uniref:Uncharacterized protein n=1 Tax=Ciona savignyi TaxID=51511 RepID=H2ZJY7_CIOSA
MPKLTYREVGCQEMILCPAIHRSVDFIEDACCQHFNKLSKQDTLKSGHKVELLFSAKGPVIREDKDLTGRSIFYFCFDEPLENRRRLCAECQATRATVPRLENDDIFMVAQNLNSRRSEQPAKLRKTQLNKSLRPQTARFSTSNPTNQQQNHSLYDAPTAIDSVCLKPNTEQACRLSSDALLCCNKTNTRKANKPEANFDACSISPQRVLKQPVLVCHRTISRSHA